MRVAVFGTGYLGATHAVCMAELGHSVVAVDVDEARLAQLRSGAVPFHERSLGEMLRRNLAAGRLQFTSSYAEAAAFTKVHFLAVGTPQQKSGPAADLSSIDAVVETLAPLLTRPTVIFGKSTVPVGTAKRLGGRALALAPAGDTVEIAWNPEFLREGCAVRDTLHPDRLVLGTDPERPGRAEEVFRRVYATLLAQDIPLLVTDLATAELTKVSANAFLATKVSFINAVADVCDIVGADVAVLADAIGYDPRIGRAFLDAGVGFGGGCLPKDILAFMARAGELGVDRAVTLLREVDTINMRRRTSTVELVREVCGSLSGARIAVLGAAFKPDSDDVRDSPALDIAGRIQMQGAEVHVYDPEAMVNARVSFPNLDYADTALAACESADAVLVLTEWEEFRKLQPTDLDAVVRQKTLIDGRNCLDPHQWHVNGWTYRGVGRQPYRWTHPGRP